jgi:hypothetical protein
MNGICYRERKVSLDNSLKGLILAAGVAITCLVISLGFYASSEAKNVAAASTSKLSEFLKELNESDIILYHGFTITGCDVVNFIKKQLGSVSFAETPYLNIFVKTSKSENTYNSEDDIANINNFTHIQYINPLGKFKGEVIRDDNDVICEIRFIQQ